MLNKSDVTGIVKDKYANVVNYISNKYSMTTDDVDNIAQMSLARFAESELFYFRFLLRPDVFRPVRIPGVFSYPTHLFRDTFSVSFAPTSGGADIVWIPRQLNTTWTTVTAPTFYGRMAYGPGTDTGSYSATTTTWVVNNLCSTMMTGGFAVNNGTRLLGSCCKIRVDMGVEDVSGVIDAGVILTKRDANNSSPAFTLVNVENMYHHTSRKASSGIYSVWMPVQKNDLEYNDYSDLVTKPLHLAYVFKLRGLPVTTAKVINVEIESFFESIIKGEFYDSFLPRRSYGVADAETVVGIAGNAVTSGAIFDSLSGQEDDKSARLFGYFKKAIKEQSSLTEDLISDPLKESFIAALNKH